MALTIEERAIDFYNSAIKHCISLGINPTKENVLNVCYHNLYVAKLTLYEVCTIDDMNPAKSIERLNLIKAQINKLCEGENENI